MIRNSTRIAAAGLILAFLWREGCCVARAEDHRSVLLQFQLLRDGEPFGRHTIRIDHRPDGTAVVENHADAAVALGPFTVFKYTYRSQEIWRDGVLLTMTSWTDDDGREVRLSAETRPDGLVLDGPEGTAVLPGGLLPTSFWTVAEMGQTFLLDTHTGHVDEVSIERMADEKGPGGVLARYRMTGDLTSDLWYDGDGLLARARFAARGAIIDYIKEPQTPTLLAGSKGAGGGS